MGNIYNIILYQPTVNILLFFNFIFLKIGLPGAFGFAIIALTALIRLLMSPFYSHQMGMSKKLAELKPHMDALSKKHKDDKKKLQEEQMKLYQQKGINPASGCIMAILQIPIFIALYSVLQLFLTNGKSGFDKVALTINKLVYIDIFKITKIDPWFFGFNLAIAPNQFGKYGYHYLLIPVLTGVLQYYQVKMSAAMQSATISTPGVEERSGKTPGVKRDDKKPETEDFQKMMSSQMKIMFPLMIGYFSFILPVGLSMYWNIFSAFTLLQKNK